MRNGSPGDTKIYTFDRNCLHLTAVVGKLTPPVVAATTAGPMADEFDSLFERLTGHRPMSWQQRLYNEHFPPDAGNDLPQVIDLPTGLGKTMVMAIWLIARTKHPDKAPSRLVYVVDRRTVVDQATDLANKLRNEAKSRLRTYLKTIRTN